METPATTPTTSMVGPEGPCRRGCCYSDARVRACEEGARAPEDAQEFRALARRLSAAAWSAAEYERVAVAQIRAASAEEVASRAAGPL